MSKRKTIKTFKRRYGFCIGFKERKGPKIKGLYDRIMAINIMEAILKEKMSREQILANMSNLMEAIEDELIARGICAHINSTTIEL